MTRVIRLAILLAAIGVLAAACADTDGPSPAAEGEAAPNVQEAAATVEPGSGCLAEAAPLEFALPEG